MNALLLAVGFLTRLPTWRASIQERHFGAAVAFFPLVGAGLGLGMYALWAGLVGRATPLLAAALVVAALAWITGGLHLDGVADVSDALGAAGKLPPEQKKARMLEIMRDSRIGALGALGLMLALGLKVAALAELRDARLLVLAPAVARLMPGLCMIGWSYARPQGLGSLFHARARAWQVALGAAPVLALAAWTGAWLAASAGLVGGLAMAWRMNRHLGGLTGDVYGAAIEIAEISFFVAAALLVPEFSTGR